jgi:hypothetical protein
MAVLLLHQLQGGRLHMVRIRIHIVSAMGRRPYTFHYDS